MLGYGSKTTNKGARFGLRPKNTEEPIKASQILEAILDGWDK